MKIGITCYPTYGGSGAIATELGMELSRRGHEVHFITYAPPFRLPYFVERLPGTQGYRMTIMPALENFPSDSPAQDAQRFNELIEAHARKVPAQYLWIHRRFKGITADYPNYYKRKG